MRRIVHVLLLLSAAFNTQAEVPERDLGRIETRADVTVRYYAVWRSDAIATLVMFSGGGGGFGEVDPSSGWTTSSNFVIRTAPQFAASGPFNVVLMGRASDTPALGYEVRTSRIHLQDNLAVLRAIKARSSLPLWLVGTSRGTVSATAAAIGDTEGLVSGLVLTSSVMDKRKPGAIPSQELSRIKVPTLVVHHRNDACKVTQADGVPSVMRGLTAAPFKESLIVSGGEDQATGDACAGMHSHGFRGIETQVVQAISQWIRIRRN